MYTTEPPTQYPTRDSTRLYSVDNSQDAIKININTEAIEQDKLNQNKFDNVAIDTVTLILPIIFTLTATAVVLNKLNRAKEVSLPCKKCKFYNSNNYLKCAVNPTEVMTDKANECREYSPQPQNFSWFSWRNRIKRG